MMEKKEVGGNTDELLSQSEKPQPAFQEIGTLEILQKDGMVTNLFKK